MFDSERRPNFQFSASAVPFAANLSKPSVVEIDPIAATVVSPVGGVVSNQCGPFEHKRVLSFKSAYSQISGSTPQNGNEYDTVLFSVLEGVNILNIFTVDKIVMAMSVKRHVEMVNDKSAYIPTSNLFDYTGCQLRGFRVAGEEVTFDLKSDVQRDAILKLSPSEAAKALGVSLKDVENLQAQLKKVRSIMALPAASRYLLGRLAPLAESVHRIGSTIVAGSKGADRYRKSDHEFEVEGFGRIIVGGVLQRPGHQVINMIRFELGCGNRGGGTGGTGGGNGDPGYPP